MHTEWELPGLQSRRWEDNTKTDLQEVERGVGLDCCGGA
jgi:hypothetical protein